MKAKKIIQHATEKELEDAMATANWKDTLKTLLAWCNHKHGKTINSLPNTPLESQDFMQHAIHDILTGTRKNWNVVSYPKLIDFIKSVIDSLVSNAYNAEIKREKLKPTISLEKAYSIGVESNTFPDEFSDEILSRLKSLDASDTELAIFLCRINGIFNPNKIKIELGITSKEYHNSSRKLERKLEKIRKSIF